MSPEAELALAPQNSKLILSRFTQWCREQPCQGLLPSLGPKFSRPSVILEKEKEEGDEEKSPSKVCVRSKPPFTFMGSVLASVGF